MKKTILLSTVLIFCAPMIQAQVFWTEDFGTGCNQGISADGYTTSTGTWTLTATGTNDTYANQWFVSGVSPYTGSGDCSVTVTCDSTGNPNLHVSNTYNPVLGLNADLSANYDAGGLCSLGSCVQTNWRVESPVIDCSGKSDVIITFYYLENGDGTNDNGVVWYYDGTTWTEWVDISKTTECSAASGTGTWSLGMVPLPASANNNPNVKIGFNWTNNDDGIGTDPSFAVDDISLSQGSVTGIATVQNAAVDFGMDHGDILVYADHGVDAVNLYDALGQPVSFTLSGNRISVRAPLSVYVVQVRANEKTIVKKVLAGH